MRDGNTIPFFISNPVEYSSFFLPNGIRNGIPSRSKQANYELNKEYLIVKIRITPTKHNVKIVFGRKELKIIPISHQKIHNINLKLHLV